MTVLVFANGDIGQTDWIRPFVAEARAILAVDGGTRHVLALGERPSLVLGDLDSLSPQLKKKLEASGTAFVIHPAAKDETDLELALLYAASHYEDDILVFGALGGRLDQTLANIFLLAHPDLNGRRVELVQPHQRAWLVEESTLIRGQVGDLVSLIPLDGDVRVGATRGLRWPLRDEVLRFGPARGISNVIEQTPAAVWLASGRLLCIHTEGGWGR